MHDFLTDCQTEAQQIIADVFKTMLDLEAVPLSGNWPPAVGPVTGAVYFAGACRGAVLIECDHPMAFGLTAKLMKIRPPQSLNEDVRDAMGELANMTGGNLKAILPAGTVLSLPSVVEGSDYTLNVLGGAVNTRLAFSSALGVFSVTLVQVLG